MEKINEEIYKEVEGVINYLLDEARKFLNNPDTPNKFETLLTVRFGTVEAKRLRGNIKKNGKNKR